MTRHPPHIDDSEITVAGGVDDSDGSEDGTEAAAAPTDSLGRTLYTLLTLHPDIEFGFKRVEIEAMDDATKTRLIDDVRRTLQVTRFKSDTL